MAQLRCENISVGYEDGIVVSDVSFELNRGDYVCIVGENGAGKSSLLKGILGLAKIQSGKIEYGDGNWKLSFDMGSNKFIRSGQVFRCMECIFLFF